MQVRSGWKLPFLALSEGPYPKLFLKAVGIQSFAVQKNRSNTRFDLVLGTHDSAMETGLQRFRFDGGRFQVLSESKMFPVCLEGEVFRKISAGHFHLRDVLVCCPRDNC